MTTRHVLKLVMIGALMIGVAACAPRVQTRGNLLDPDRVAEIKPGEQTRQEVAEILGSPSALTAFGSNTWYYIAKRTETLAFFKPEVTERQVIVIKFGDDGKVSHVDALGLEAGREIKPVARVTPTHGNKMTVLEQLIGNLGRFRKSAEEKAAERRRKEEKGENPYEY